MQPENPNRRSEPTQSGPNSGRLFKAPQPFLHRDLGVNEQDQLVVLFDVADQPTQRYAAISAADTRARLPYQQLDAELEADFDSNNMNTMRLMQLSGMLQAVHVPQTAAYPGPTQKLAPGQQPPAAWGIHTPKPRPNINTDAQAFNIDQPFSPEELSQISQAMKVVMPPKAQPAWRVFLNQPAVKVVLGIGVGLLMLLLVSRVVNVPTTIHILQVHLATRQGMIYALLTALSFISAFTIRGTRWKMFLRPITNVSVFKVIRIYWVGVFINVLLPVQGGEVAKSLMLRSITGVPVSQSLPTVAMDKSLDLMPALIIMAVVGFIPGIHMTITLWLILGTVASILLSVIFVVALTAWNRTMAIRLIKTVCGFLPKGLGTKIEGFAMGFVDSLLAGVSRPKTFIPAALLTCLAISCDGLFAMFAFWTVGVSTMNFGTAIFGYTLFNMFLVIPSLPGGVGSNELYGILVFSQLLGFDKSGVLGMFFFSHPLTAMLMAIIGLICLSTLGLKLSAILKPANESPKQPPKNGGTQQSVQKQQMVMA